jgi:hypothetical protein
MRDALDMKLFLGDAFRVESRATRPAYDIFPAALLLDIFYSKSCTRQRMCNVIVVTA